MALNIYETLMTKNAKLAKFTDENPNIAGLFKKIIGVVSQIAMDWRVDASKIEFDLRGSPDGKMLLIRVIKK